MTDLRHTPKHHLFWYLPSRKNPAHYYCGPNASSLPVTVNIRTLMSHYQSFHQYLDFSLRPTTSKLGLPDGQTMRDVICRLNQGEQVPRAERLKLAATGLALGVAPWVQAVQTHRTVFETELPKRIFELINFYPEAQAWRDHLIFLTTCPHFYFWSTPQPRDHSDDSVLVCFTTRRGALNMPLNQAHLILSQSFSKIIYVVHQSTDTISTGIGGLGLERSAQELQRILHHFGLKKAVALGASYGGLVGTLMTDYLPEISRFLSFSGPFTDVKAKLAVEQKGTNYDPENYRLVLSATDETDQAIEKKARALNLDQSLYITNLQDHGTFSASFLDQSLSTHLDWLKQPIEKP